MGEMIQKPDTNPILIGALNFLLCGGVGYFLMGQKKKAIISLVISVLTTWCGVGFIWILIATYDAFVLGQKLQRGESIGENVDDAWIHTKIRTKFLGEGQLPGGGVNVDVKNNVVTLRGHVKTKEDRAKLEEIAKLTDGVKSVKNLLTVKPD